MDAKYVSDQSGKKTAVRLPAEDYEGLLEDIHALTIITAGKGEPAISLANLKKRLETDQEAYQHRSRLPFTDWRIQGNLPGRLGLTRL
jgi:hypothetical protein